jgi:hypothetical protein
MTPELIGIKFSPPSCFKKPFFSGKETFIQVNKCMLPGQVKQSIGYALPVDSEILVTNFK